MVIHQNHVVDISQKWDQVGWYGLVCGTLLSCSLMPRPTNWCSEWRHLTGMPQVGYWVMTMATYGVLVGIPRYLFGATNQASEPRQQLLQDPQLPRPLAVLTPLGKRHTPSYPISWSIQHNLCVLPSLQFGDKDIQYLTSCILNASIGVVDTIDLLPLVRDNMLLTCKHAASFLRCSLIFLMLSKYLVYLSCPLPAKRE